MGKDAGVQTRTEEKWVSWCGHTSKGWPMKDYQKGVPIGSPIREEREVASKPDGNKIFIQIIL